jgi:hypothetical protein
MATSPVPPIPSNSLSLDATIFLGKNHVRRVASKLANVYTGDNTNAQDFVIPAASNGIPGEISAAFSKQTTLLIATVSSPVQVEITFGENGGFSTKVIPLNQLLMLDSGVTSVRFLNSSLSEIQAQVVSLV